MFPLDYRVPRTHPLPLDWRLLRFTVPIQLFVTGWFLFSLYVWYRFGSGWIGSRPALRMARDMCEPRIAAATMLMTILNLIYLLVRLKSDRRPAPWYWTYLTLAAVPTMCLVLTEELFGYFVVE